MIRNKICHHHKNNIPLASTTGVKGHHKEREGDIAPYRVNRIMTVSIDITIIICLGTLMALTLSLSVKQFAPDKLLN